jgi:hypothetical protein
MGIIKGTSNLILTVVASIMFVLMGIVYFMISIWIIKIGAQWAGFSDIAGNTVVLTSGIITAATVIGSAIQK